MNNYQNYYLRSAVSNENVQEKCLPQNLLPTSRLAASEIGRRVGGSNDRRRLRENVTISLGGELTFSSQK